MKGIGGMKVYYVDMHCNIFFLRSINWILFRHKAPLKQRYILDYLVNDENIEVINLVTKEGTTLPTRVLRKITRYIPLRVIEARIVHALNHLGGKVRIETNYRKIGERDCVVLYPQFGTIPKELVHVKCKKIADHIHFYGLKEKAEVVRYTNTTYYFFDVDLGKYSKLFQKNYFFMKDGFCWNRLAFQTRFKAKTRFSERKNKCMAIGTVTRCSYEEFMDVYGSGEYQPRRKMVYDEAGKYSEEIDSYMSEYQNDSVLTINERDYWISKMVKKIYNFFNSGKQKKYFSFDIVEKYNEYQMFVCPEDINGSPGVGTFEGMACGCAMIGRDYGAFEDMGMLSGIHYIAYDGTMENMIDKIRYYQRPENISELEKIAKKGCEFVRIHFNQDTAAREYLDVLKNL